MIKNEVFLRIISALFLIPYVSGMIYYGGLPYILSVIAFTGLIFYEWVRMVWQDKEYNYVLIVLGIFYFLPFMVSMIGMRLSGEHGIVLTLLMISGVWISDIFAYVIGKWLKGPKIVPLISPKKTWSGFIAALLFPALYYVTVAFFFDQEHMVLAFGGGIVLGLASQFGDFFVSIIKRHVGVKDTGVIVPGHGGMLDRMDALVLATPIFYLMVKVLL